MIQTSLKSAGQYHRELAETVPVAPHLYPAAMRPHHLPYKIQSQAEARSPRGTTA